MRFAGLPFFVVTAAVAVSAGAVPPAPSSSRPVAATLPSFDDLPAPASRPAGARGRLNAGTDGLALPAPVSAPDRTTLVLLGDLAPGDSAEREKLLRTAVSEINLLHPDAVLTVGNLIPGLTRSGQRYVAEIQHTRGLLDELTAPWFPCAGVTDVLAGTRLAADRRFEQLYQRYVGPLYFSADVGGSVNPNSSSRRVHVIVLDSEETLGAGSTISAAQLGWLKDDLNRTFNAGRAGEVIVLSHRPLWQDAASNWRKVHDLLVEFNRRPIATFEGPNTSASQGVEARGPQVRAVFAGGRRAYSQEPARDGIPYLVLGPTAAAPRAGLSTAEALRHFTLLKFDAAGDMHTALVQLHPAASDAPMILPESFITAAERAVLDNIAAWDDAVLGVEGVINERGESLPASATPAAIVPVPASAPNLTFHIANPLSEAVDVQLRLAPGSWDLLSPPPQRHVTAAGTAGARLFTELALRHTRPGDDHPIVQAVVLWPDTRGRVHEIVVPRPITVVPSVSVNIADKPIELADAEGWAGVSSASISAWAPRADAPRKADPTVALRADADRLLVRVHVADDVRSYWPDLTLDPAWGGLASDAVTVTFARSNQPVQRIWLVPAAAGHAPAAATAPEDKNQKSKIETLAPALYLNTGTGSAQTELKPLDPAWGVQAVAVADASGYTVTFSLPRKLVCEEVPASPPAVGIPLLTPPPPSTRVAATAEINVAVHDNDETARTWTKSWVPDSASPAAWAKVQLVLPTQAFAPHLP
jgi:hypothetical protein